MLLAAPALAFPYVAALFSPAPVFLFGITLIRTTVTAVRLAFRYRETESGNVAWSMAWLVGTGLGIAAMVFVVSLLSPIFP